uniref:Uncharacterized protein n=1 Tax=viral metagenome TaxID=1070528 RepID=A0A6M3LKE1_9ZZZZ
MNTDTALSDRELLNGISQIVESDTVKVTLLTMCGLLAAGNDEQLFMLAQFCAAIARKEHERLDRIIKVSAVLGGTIATETSEGSGGME